MYNLLGPTLCNVAAARGGALPYSVKFPREGLEVIHGPPRFLPSRTVTMQTEGRHIPLALMAGSCTRELLNLKKDACVQLEQKHGLWDVDLPVKFQEVFNEDPGLLENVERLPSARNIFNPHEYDIVVNVKGPYVCITGSRNADRVLAPFRRRMFPLTSKLFHDRYDFSNPPRPIDDEPVESKKPSERVLEIFAKAPFIPQHELRYDDHLLRQVMPILKQYEYPLESIVADKYENMYGRPIPDDWMKDVDPKYIVTGRCGVAANLTGDYIWLGPSTESNESTADEIGRHALLSSWSLPYEMHPSANVRMESVTQLYGISACEAGDFTWLDPPYREPFGITACEYSYMHPWLPFEFCSNAETLEYLTPWRPFGISVNETGEAMPWLYQYGVYASATDEGIALPRHSNKRLQKGLALPWTVKIVHFEGPLALIAIVNSDLIGSIEKHFRDRLWNRPDFESLKLSAAPLPGTEVLVRRGSRTFSRAFVVKQITETWVMVYLYDLGYTAHVRWTKLLQMPENAPECPPLTYVVEMWQLESFNPDNILFRGACRLTMARQGVFKAYPVCNGRIAKLEDAFYWKKTRVFALREISEEDSDGTSGPTVNEKIRNLVLGTYFPATLAVGMKYTGTILRLARKSLYVVLERDMPAAELLAECLDWLKSKILFHLPASSIEDDRVYLVLHCESPGRSKEQTVLRAETIGGWPAESSGDVIRMYAIDRADVITAKKEDIFDAEDIDIAVAQIPALARRCSLAGVAEATPQASFWAAWMLGHDWENQKVVIDVKALSSVVPAVEVVKKDFVNCSDDEKLAHTLNWQTNEFFDGFAEAVQRSAGSVGGSAVSDEAANLPSPNNQDDCSRLPFANQPALGSFSGADMPLEPPLVENAVASESRALGVAAGRLAAETPFNSWMPSPSLPAQCQLDMNLQENGDMNLQADGGDSASILGDVGVGPDGDGQEGGGAEDIYFDDGGEDDVLDSEEDFEEESEADSGLESSQEVYENVEQEDSTEDEQ